MFLMFMSMLIGLTLFLFGMQLIRIGLENITLDRVRIALKHLTKTPAIGMVTGTFTTMLVQSSSAVTIITISLANSNILNFMQTVGIILGTNIGTSFTALLFTLDIVAYFWIFLGIGLLFTLIPRMKLKFIGVAIIGFGLVFWGLTTITTGLSPIKESPLILQLVSNMSSYTLTAIIAGTVFTAIVQSSSATTAIAVALAQQNLISLEAGIGLILGSNVGTCFTAIIASIGGNRIGKQVAMAHVILNILGVVLIYPFIPHFSSLVSLISTNLTSQIVWAQIIFNIGSSIAVLPFVKPFAQLVLFFVPNRK